MEKCGERRKKKKYIPDRTNGRIMTALRPKSKSKVASRFLKERFRSHQKSLALIGCCKLYIEPFLWSFFFPCVDAQVS